MCSVTSPQPLFGGVQSPCVSGSQLGLDGRSHSPPSSIARDLAHLVERLYDRALKTGTDEDWALWDAAYALL